MAALKTSRKRRKLSESEIDDMVVAQSKHNAAWSKPVQIKRVSDASVLHPQDVALRAEFFSRLHRSKNLHEWLTRIIQDRLDMEEAAYHELKRDLIKSR